MTTTPQHFAPSPRQEPAPDSAAERHAAPPGASSGSASPGHVPQRRNPLPAPSDSPARSAAESLERMVPQDETDMGWGDPPYDGDDERILRELPPHHVG